MMEEKVSLMSYTMCCYMYTFSRFFFSLSLSLSLFLLYISTESKVSANSNFESINDSEDALKKKKKVTFHSQPELCREKRDSADNDEGLDNKEVKDNLEELRQKDSKNNSHKAKKDLRHMLGRQYEHPVRIFLRLEQKSLEDMKKKTEDKTEAIRKKKKKIADMKLNRIATGNHRILHGRLELKYKIAKSNWRLKNLESELSKLEKKLQRKADLFHTYLCTYPVQGSTLQLASGDIHSIWRQIWKELCSA